LYLRANSSFLALYLRANSSFLASYLNQTARSSHCTSEQTARSSHRTSIKQLVPRTPLVTPFRFTEEHPQNSPKCTHWHINGPPSSTNLRGPTNKTSKESHFKFPHLISLRKSA
jgi:hypothetical protein